MEKFKTEIEINHSDLVNVFTNKFFDCQNSDSNQITSYKQGVSRILSYLRHIHSQEVKCPNPNCNSFINFATYMYHDCQSKRQKVPITKEHNLFKFLCLSNETVGIFLTDSQIVLSSQCSKKNISYQGKRLSNCYEDFSFGQVSIVNTKDRLESLIDEKFPKLRIVHELELGSYYGLFFSNDIGFYMQEQTEVFTEGIYYNLEEDSVVIMDKTAKDCGEFQGELSPSGDPLQKFNVHFMMISNTLGLDFCLFEPNLGKPFTYKKNNAAKAMENFALQLKMNDQQHQSLKHFKDKNIAVIWFDGNDSPENQRLNGKLSSVCSVMRIHMEWRKKCDFSNIERYSGVHVITSGSFSDDVIKNLASRDNVDSISIFCKSLEFHNQKQFKKRGKVSRLPNDILDYIGSLL